MIGKRTEMRFPQLAAAGGAALTHRTEVVLGDSERPVSCPVYLREQLGAGARIAGPALVREHGTTTVLFEGDTCSLAASGELIIGVRGAA